MKELKINLKVMDMVRVIDRNEIGQIIAIRADSTCRILTVDQLLIDALATNLETIEPIVNQKNVFNYKP